MVAPVITLPSSMFLFSVGVGLIVSVISLIYKAKTLGLEQAKEKKELAKEIMRTTYWLIGVAILALGWGVILMQWYLSSLLLPR